jgi:hypothetical protein
VNSHRALGQTEIDDDDLVRLAVDNRGHHFAFARRERLGAATQIGVRLHRLAILGILLERSVDAVDQVLLLDAVADYERARTRQIAQRASACSVGSAFVMRYSW